MKVRIVEATLDMCRDLAEVKRRVWESTYRGIYPDSKFDSFDIEKEAEKFARLIEADDIDLYVAVVDDVTIGFMAEGKNPRYPDSESCEIVLLSIVKECQGLGIGREMFDFAKGKLKMKNADHFIVYCNKYNLKAQGFYKKMGCEVLSIDDDHPDKSIPQVKFVYRF